MAEPHYNHPGEVREAMNFRCLHCSNDIFTTPQGLNGHLSKVHNIEPRNLQYKKDWDITTDVAGDNIPSPAENRNVSTIISGDRQMKSEQEKTHNFECLVPGCDAVYTSSPGMSKHQQVAHGNKGSIRDVNWRWTTKPTTLNDKRSRAAQERKGIKVGAAATIEQQELPRPKREYVRRQPVVLTPDTGFIEIAAVIRVPITIGQAEIRQKSDLLT